MLDETATKLGGVETWQDAQLCAELFQRHGREIDGILVCLPNFGDEKGVADTIKLSGLRVPILVQAYPDMLDQFMVERRRDAFCGKVSVCNNLRQYGYAYSLTDAHTIHPLAPAFRVEMEKFLGVCRVVKGLRTARLGAVGARPGAFNTVRYSEKLLQHAGMTVTTLDLSEVLGWVSRLPDDNEGVAKKLADIKSYADYGNVPPPSLVKMAKLGVVLEKWMDENGLVATALQCWTSLQRNFGVNVCTLMSIMSERLMPSACEVDITGVASMYAQQLASNRPSALVDWNNNYGDDPNKCVFFHCGNWAKSFIPEAEISTAPILGTTLGVENTWGAMAGRTPSGPVTFARITTDDVHGAIRTYVGEGRFTDDRLDTFGTRAVVEVPGLQKLMRYVCRNGFEHHVSMNGSHTAGVLAEAFTTYFGWETYQHE
jgi:L-fucose isomerase-like protein